MDQCLLQPSPAWEDTRSAAEKRLQEEMGIVTPLTKAFDFIYKASFDNGLTEHEFDHVFTGTYHGSIDPNPEEVSAYCYKPIRRSGKPSGNTRMNIRSGSKLLFPDGTVSSNSFIPLRTPLFQSFTKHQIATAIAVFFHAVGMVGLLYYDQGFFIQATPFNLLLSFALLLWTWEDKNISFFFAACFLTGFAAEVIGVNTGMLFGDYRYGDVLGYKAGRPC